MRNSARRRAEKTTKKTAARKARKKTCARERDERGVGVVLVRVHAANYERSEGAKQCVVFHPQAPPNNIRRNFFFPHSVNSTFF
jgi:hypothetical protein